MKLLRRILGRKIERGRFNYGHVRRFFIDTIECEVTQGGGVWKGVNGPLVW